MEARALIESSLSFEVTWFGFEFEFDNNGIQFEFEFIDEIRIRFSIRFVHIDISKISRYKIYEGSCLWIVTAQTTMKSTLDFQIVELKTIMERASQLTTQTPSTLGSPWGDHIAQERTWVIQIVPTSVRLPPSVEVEQAGFIEIDLVGIPIESLQMVQTQVHEELKERELIMYA